jgi:hypothetical protein
MGWQERILDMRVAMPFWEFEGDIVFVVYGKYWTEGMGYGGWAVQQNFALRVYDERICYFGRWMLCKFHG